MLNQFKFNTEEECIQDYISNYNNITTEDIETYYTNYDKKKLFCMRIKGTRFMDTFRTYKVTTKGNFILNV